MNADEAKREAVKVLAMRLKHRKAEGDNFRDAQAFMDDMRLAGWIWMPPENRPTPPKRDEACLRCGRHVDRCCCESAPQVRPLSRSERHAEHVAELRRIKSEAMHTTEEPA